MLTAALQVGAAAWVTDLAVEYAKQRRQFGRPIGGFQAVKHLCADMAVRAEMARCAVHAAAVTADQPDVGDLAEAAAAAKLLADEAAITNGRSCIQVHGGMGFTWDVPAHLAYKRSRVLATRFGTDDQLAEQLAGAPSRSRPATYAEPVSDTPVPLPSDTVPVLPGGRTVFGMQLPIQSQSTIYTQAWETVAGPDELARVALACEAAGFFYVGVCDQIATLVSWSSTLKLAIARRGITSGSQLLRRAHRKAWVAIKRPAVTWAICRGPVP